MDWGKLWFRIFPTAAWSFRMTAKDLLLVVASQRLGGVFELRAPSVSDDAPARALAAAPVKTIGRVACSARWSQSRSAPRSVCRWAVSWPRPTTSPTVATSSRRSSTKTRSSLNESSASLRRAAVAVDRTQSALVAAEAALAKTRRQLAAATQRDQLMAAKLTKAQADLARAKAAVVVGQQRLDAQDALAGEMVRDQYQQQTNLLPIALLVESTSTADLLDQDPVVDDHVRHGRQRDRPARRR